MPIAYILRYCTQVNIEKCRILQIKIVRLKVNVLKLERNIPHILEGQFKQDFSVPQALTKVPKIVDAAMLPKDYQDATGKKLDFTLNLRLELQTYGKYY